MNFEIKEYFILDQLVKNETKEIASFDEEISNVFKDAVVLEDDYIKGVVATISRQRDADDNRVITQSQYETLLSALNQDEASEAAYLEAVAEFTA